MPSVPGAYGVEATSGYSSLRSRLNTKNSAYIRNKQEYRNSLNSLNLDGAGGSKANSFLNSLRSSAGTDTTSNKKQTASTSLKERTEEEKINYNLVDFGVPASGNNLDIKGLNGVFGIPYQFLASVDRRVDGSVDDNESLGRMYNERIANHMPLLFICPCRPKFMEGSSIDDRSKIVDTLLNGIEDAATTLSGIQYTGRYYSTEYAYAEYYSIVNLMCKQVAFLMGIENENLGGMYVDSINWADSFSNAAFKDYELASNAVVFYTEGLTTISDSISNSTTDSQLASTINGFADQAKELRFILGSNSALSGVMNLASTVTTTITDKMNELGLGNLTGGMLGDLATNGVSVIMTGGKILFPKIWGDSTFSRSYSFDIKLRSPDHDPLSVYMNILVPYLHLLGLCLPQSITEGAAAKNPNAYNSPFLVRAYSRGQFNINMGIITDMSVTRGGEGQWNDAGLPTQIDISITIEDLYSTLFLSNPKGSNALTTMFNDLVPLDIVNNSEMMDFLSNMAGLNVANASWGDQAQMFGYLMTKAGDTIGANIKNTFRTEAARIMDRVATYF